MALDNQLEMKNTITTPNDRVKILILQDNNPNALGS